MAENAVARVDVTAEAERLIRRLQKQHGALLIHQSGGCCDGSSPMCYPRGDFMVGHKDVFLGVIVDCPVYIDADQFEYWSHTHLTIDAVKGRGGGFSLEAPEGYRFLTRSRVFTDDEAAILKEMGPPPRADEIDMAALGI